MSLEVFVLTKDSVEPCLEDCFRSIVEEIKQSPVPVSLHVIDGGSHDQTRDIAEKYGAKVHMDFGNRATARQQAIDRCESQYLAFIDSDIVLNPGWFTDALKLMETDQEIGAIWGYAEPSMGSHREYYDAMAKVYGKSVKELEMRNAEVRGFTHDTIIRTKALHGIRIPSTLETCEDEYIRRHIISQGYTWLNTDTFSCKHYRNLRAGQEQYTDTIHSIEMGIVSKKQVARHCFLCVPKILYLAYKTRNWEIVSMESKREYLFVKAVLKYLWSRLT